jgi:molybdopterin-guanine dinucleotide biosynthesis protein A
MGVEKAGIAWEGSTLLSRAVEALSPVCDVVVVVRSAGQELPALPGGVRVVEDAHADRGPLEGLAAGLRAVGPGAVGFVCAADMPLLDAGFAAAVLAALPPGSDAAVPRVDGRPQPLAAAYRTDAVRAIEELLASGGRSMGALLDRLEVRWLDDLPGAAEAVRNVNTPAELEAARQASREKATTEPAAPSSSSPTQASAVAPASDVNA